MATASAPVSLDEFLKLPEEEPALEFVNGVITQKVTPRAKHSLLQLDLAKRIDHIGLPSKRARAFTELRVTFGGASRVPDVAVLAWDRIPRDQSGEVQDEVFGPPDIVAEIASPEQSPIVLRQKCEWYVANGVGVALLIDPSSRAVMSFRPGEPPLILTGSENVDLREVLPDFDLTVDQLFAALR